MKSLKIFKERGIDMKKAISVPEQLKMQDDTKSNVIAVARAAKAGVPNANGYTYSKELFDDAMNNYIRVNGHIYLAPIEDNSYASFVPSTRDVLGKITNFDDDKVYVELQDLTYFPESYLPIIHYIMSNTKELQCRMRYAAETNSVKEITRMGITSCDIATLTDVTTDKTLSTMPWGDWLIEREKKGIKPSVQLPTKNVSIKFDWNK